MTTNKLEIEVKIKVDDLKKIKKEIIKLGFHSIAPYSFEHNILFDTKDERLKKNKLLLRLRKVEDKYIVTFKHPPEQSLDSSHYKIRQEKEIEVSNYENIISIFTGLGFNVFFIYEKYREIFDNGNVKIMMDHTPIGDFIEIEGDAETIDKTAAQLGYSKSDYITENYMTLFKRKHKTGFMQFESSVANDQ
ncbi:MAG: class IV adenylate cyclase [Candidatus Aminicenantes bacterium]